MNNNNDDRLNDLIDGAMIALATEIADDVSPPVERDSLAVELQSAARAVVGGYLIGRRDGMKFVEKAYRDR